MNEIRHRHQHRHEEGRFLRFLRAYWFEIIWIVIVALGILLISDRMNIRATLTRWLGAGAASLFHGTSHLEQSIATFLAGMTLSDALGCVLILAALVVVLGRIRWRMMRSPTLTTLRCPRCGGQIHRVHRRLRDRLISLYVPVRRYRCANGSCRWRGLRVGAPHRPGHLPTTGHQPQAKT